MSTKILGILFGTGIVIDILVTPLVGAPFWMPSASLAALATIFFFAPSNFAIAALLVQALLIRLTTGLNLGILVFSLGILFLIETRLIPHYLHTTTWQSLYAAALGLMITLVLLMTLSTFLTTEDFSFGLQSIAMSITTTLLTLVMLFGVRKAHHDF